MSQSSIDLFKALATHPSLADSEIVADNGDKAETGIRYIRPPKGWTPIDFGELFRYRELLYFLIWRDFKVRYKQTVLGIGWALLQPVFSMIVFTVIFGRLAGLSSDGYPYSIYVYAGLLPWTFFASGVNLGGLSLVNQQHLLTKVYFPRLFVPTAAVGIGLLDMLVAGALYVVLMVSFRQPLTMAILALPILVLLLLAATLGLSYLLAALTVSYRDFRFVVPFMMQAMMYISPVVYPVSIVPEKYHWLMALNPMVGIIDGFRSALVGKPWNLTTLGVSAVATLALLIFGMLYFRRTEQYFADIA